MNHLYRMMGVGGCLAMSLLVGCLGTRSSESARFYRLQSVLPTTEAEPASDGQAIAVGPVEVAPYLRRPQMASRVSPHEVRYSELHRWAEPLDKNIGWVVAENLSGRLPGRSVFLFGSPHAVGAGSILVEVRVTRLEATPEGKALLRASWAVMGGKQDVAPATQVFSSDIDIEGATPEDIVAAISALLGSLSEDIAEELR